MENCRIEGQEPQDMINTNDQHLGNIIRPRSNTCPNLYAASNSRKLKHGSKVIILGTDNVEQRVPQYVGAEAIIVDVPVHPSTWYKVQFSDGSIVTFRPSALKLASECEISSNGNPPSFHHVQPSKHSKARSSSGDGAKNLLGNINPDFWPSSKVKILSGKFAGQSAIVKCSGNGWVQLDTPLGEVAKRATELELIELGKQSVTLSKPSGGLSISIPASLSSSNVRRRSNSESLVMSPTARLPQVELSPRQSKVKESRTVLVDPKIRSLQTDYFRKYVEKEIAKVKGRPDLKYWNRQIHSTMIDENHEREVARDIRDNYCHFCNVEKWPGSIVCWNELCTASPIYWKLPGAAGSPIVPESRYRRMESVFTSGNAKRGHEFDDDHEPKRLKSQRTLVMTDQALEEERIACQILGSLSSLSPGECFPNIVTEFVNTSPIIQIPSPTSPTASTTSSSSGASPYKPHAQKNERSDSGATDSEDVVRSENAIQTPLILKYKGGQTVTKEFHPPLHTVPETRPLQLPSDSLRASLNQKHGTVASSPTGPQKFKKPRSPFSPTKGGMLLAQGTPPTHEEFARFVTEHHFTQKSNSNFPLQQENKTPPLSALTARVDAQRRSETKPQDVFSGHDVATGPPLLGPPQSSSKSTFPH